MSNLIQDAKEQISSILNRACEKAVGKGELPAGAVLSGSVEIPKDTANGDYAANHAMTGARALHMAPRKIAEALGVAGLFGNLVRHNASISGAEVGCQGEVGVACAMASAATCQLFGGTPSQIEYAAEMGLEHHLGMTCDPVCGLVQIPCIERNAFAACRALDAQLYASLSDGKHRVSFDKVVDVMKRTGHDIPSLYKETSEGGLAKEF